MKQTQVLLGVYRVDSVPRVRQISKSTDFEQIKASQSGSLSQP